MKSALSETEVQNVLQETISYGIILTVLLFYYFPIFWFHVCLYYCSNKK